MTEAPFERSFVEPFAPFVQQKTARELQRLFLQYDYLNTGEMVILSKIFFISSIIRYLQNSSYQSGDKDRLC